VILRGNRVTNDQNYIEEKQLFVEKKIIKGWPTKQFKCSSKQTKQKEWNSRKMFKSGSAHSISSLVELSFVHIFVHI
jgi:hypothetical protein